jgi:TonB family protein
MKKIIFLFFILSVACYGYEKGSDTTGTNTADSLAKQDYLILAEQMPEPIGGIDAIMEKIVYPEKAIADSIEGKVYVQTFINENGDVVKTKIIKGAHPLLDSAAMKAVQEVKFTPGIVNGKKVKVQVLIPIVFKLD